MYYIITAKDIDDSLSLRKTNLEAHVQRLKDLHLQGKLLVTGPFPNINTDNDITRCMQNGFGGSLTIAEFENLTEAQIWADNDPLMKAGAYKEINVIPFIKSDF
jgi:uncharacterized protein YciI